jgi:putative hydrolase of HD superfamily
VVIGDSVRARGLSRFYRQIVRLKSTPRTGWIDRGVPPELTESVADHSFHTALLAWLVAASDPTLDRDRILKLALIHDLPEAIIGDMPPYDPQTVPDSGADRAAWRAFLDRKHVRSTERRTAKRTAEAAAMQQLLGDLHGNARVELASLWHELAEGLTAEARFVKQTDRLETFLQSRVYLEDDPQRPMSAFAEEVDEGLVHPALIAVRDAARSE